MAEFIPAENVARVEFVYTLHGNKVENVLHFENTAGGFGVTEMALLGLYLKNWHEQYLKTLQSNQCTINMLRITDQTTQNSPGIEYTTGFPYAGNMTDPAAPGNVAVAVKLTTGLRGRSFRGRNFFMGFRKDDCNGNVISSGIRTGLETAYGQLISAPAADWQLVVVSRYHNHVARTQAIVTPVVGVSCDGNLDSMRRRLNNRGE